MAGKQETKRNQTSLSYLVAQLDFQFIRNIKVGNRQWAIGNKQWANGRQIENQVQPTSLFVAQLDVKFMRNMAWQKLQPTPLPWIIALLFKSMVDNSKIFFKLNRSIPNLRAADTIKSRLNLVHGNLSKVSLHMRLKQLRQGQTSAI